MTSYNPDPDLTRPLTALDDLKQRRPDGFNRFTDAEPSNSVHGKPDLVGILRELGFEDSSTTSSTSERILMDMPIQDNDRKYRLTYGKVVDDDPKPVHAEMAARIALFGIDKIDLVYTITQALLQHGYKVMVKPPMSIGNKLYYFSNDYHAARVPIVVDILDNSAAQPKPATGVPEMAR